MKGLAELRKRVIKLEQSTPTSVVSFQLVTGVVRKMKAKQVLNLCAEALYGSKSSDVMTLIESVSNTCSHRLVDLLKMCCSD
jgi:hypothetical protein